MDATQILVLFVIWFLFWGIYNFVLIGRGFSTEKTPGILSLVYLGFSLVALLTTGSLRGLELSAFILIFLLVIAAAFITRDKIFGRISNSLFQMVWLFSIWSVTGRDLIAVALLFSLGHLPCFLVRHLKLKAKTLVFLAASLGGLIFALLLAFLPFPYNLATTVLLHFMVYYCFRPYDQKYKLNIIN